MNKNSKPSVFILLSLIIIISVFLRAYNIKNLPPGLYPDEAMNGNNALEAISTGNWKVFYPENNGREGLFINIQGLSIEVFGNEPWALRIVSVIFGTLTVLGVYFLAKELFIKLRIPRNEQQPEEKIIPLNQKIALLSAFLIATSFWHINFSRIGFRAIMAPFFLTWALYFLLKGLRSQKWLLYGIISGFVYGLGMHSYIAYRATPLLIIVIFGIWFFTHKESRKAILKFFIVFVFFSLLAFAPLGYYFLKNPADFMGRTSQVSVFNSEAPLKNLALNIIKTLGMFGIVGDYNWRHNISGSPQLFWPVGLIFLIGILFGLISIFKKPLNDRDKTIRFASWVLFSALAIVSLPVVISNEGIPHALRSIIMIPPVFILAGFGGVWFYEFLKNHFGEFEHGVFRKFLFIASVVFLIFLPFNAYYDYFIRWGKNYNVSGAFATDYVAIGRGLNNLPPERPKYVIVQAPGVEVRGIPMPSQTVMFITDTFTPEKQTKKNIYYKLPSQIDQIPKGSYTVTIK